MIRHPGGLEQTKKLIELAGLKRPCRIMDLGAGDGETVHLLSEYGFDAIGIDKEPGEGIIQGDFLHTEYEEGSFDAVITECALFISGDREQGIAESARVLKSGGKFLYGDVWFDSEEEICQMMQRHGFGMIVMKDVTRAWQEYYIQSIWDDTFVWPCCDIPKKKCNYYLIVCEKI